MPVYNGGQFLHTAIESILNQSFNDFEYLIIDDGSTDDSTVIVRSYHDPRIRLIVNKHNIGLVGTLNIGLCEARGYYIARMDQDDWSHPHRLVEQVGFLDANPEYGLVGSWIDVVNTDMSTRYVDRFPVTDDMIRLMLSMQNAFAHGAVMMRKNLQVQYRSEFDLAEDFDLWCRLSAVTKMANIAKALYRWTYNPAGITLSQASAQFAVAKRIQTWYNHSPGSRRPHALTRQTVQQERAARGRKRLWIDLVRLTIFFLRTGDVQRFLRIGFNALEALVLP